MYTTGKSSQNRSRPVLSRDEILHQISTLVNSPEDDLHAALMRELLMGLLKLNDAHLDLLDVKIVNRAVKELRHAFGVFHGYRDRQKVSIFGSARTPSDDPNYRLAHQFAHAIVQEGFMVITGGADGIMRAAQEGAGRENSFGVN
ncbi:MAG: cytochrome D ubiquinol oxidase subunit II, partial [Nitrospira sp.]|nr:cytochrome D ubiquinol oxidase subunit II [Nitrospira sp.]